MNKLTGTLVYVQVNKPVDCFVKDKGQEWKASIIVDEDTADAWNELYPKQTASVIKTSEFESVFKIPPPFPDAKKQFQITLRKNTKYTKTEKDAEGNEVKNSYDVPEEYHPKVFLQTENGREDITHTKLVANGSKGIISVQVRELRVGNVANLGNVLVTDLVEYKAAKKEAGSEFDDIAPPKAVDTKVTGSKPVNASDEDEPF